MVKERVDDASAAGEAKAKDVFKLGRRLLADGETYLVDLIAATLVDEKTGEIVLDQIKNFSIIGITANSLELQVTYAEPILRASLLELTFNFTSFEKTWDAAQRFTFPVHFEPEIE